jgi:hypothetical protein
MPIGPATAANGGMLPTPLPSLRRTAILEGALYGEKEVAALSRWLLLIFVVLLGLLLIGLFRCGDDRMTWLGKLIDRGLPC